MTKFFYYVIIIICRGGEIGRHEGLKCLVNTTDLIDTCKANNMEEQEFVKTVNECKSMAHAAKLVGMAYSTFIRKAKKLNCYRPNPSGKGLKKTSGKKIPIEEILEGKHPYYQTYKLKIRLVKDGILKDECSLCGWKEKPQGHIFSPCELDHKNGNPLDHRLENLRLICPNCHSLTETYRFRRGKTNGSEHQDGKPLE